MTTDNPDPLEVLVESIACAIAKVRHPDCDPHGVIREGLVAWQVYQTEAEAAAAIIAQHYAPVIAEIERLDRAALTDKGDGE